jgi:hypothetical protein
LQHKKQVITTKKTNIMRATNAEQAKSILAKYQLRTVWVSEFKAQGRTYHVVHGMKMYGGEDLKIDISAKTAKELKLPNSLHDALKH